MSSTADEEDNNSLFGSPPPSPDGGSFERDIGTIALPGSFMSCSGLPAYVSSFSIPSASNPGTDVPQRNDLDTTDVAGVGSQGRGPQRSTVKRKYQKRSTTSSRSTTTDRSANAGPLPSRDEVLKSARQRQRQLIAELECAKIELWEASIEGGVLVHLMRDSRINSQRTAGRGT
ncbi:hypothetical protein V8B97DRAFT_1123838 [Scleroderma yunnanense]